MHKTPRTEEALTVLEGNPGDCVIDTIVHNEILYTFTAHLLEHKYNIRGVFSIREWIRKHGYPQEVVHAVKELIMRLNIKLIQSIYTEQELYKTLHEYRLLPSDAIIALTCKHYGIDTIITFDEDFKRIPWLKAIP